MERKIKIKVDGLCKFFGGEKQKIRKLLLENKTKSEILSKTGCNVGVANASFEVYEGEIFVVMGLSGSGKSTLLRCLNRLITPTFGSIFLDDYDLTKADKQKLREIRREEVAMVFQHFGLLPHRDVISNIAFGLEIANVPLEKREAKAEEILKTVGLHGYGRQMCKELSGGMQQRVGLGRALAMGTDILLMDEAFSALDPLIRNNMQDELLDMQEKLNKTIVFITHDLDEALKLGDRIAIMKDAKIVQIGTPEEILSDPANSYVRDFVEQVDSAKIITVSKVMRKNPDRILNPKDGPKVAIRLMRKHSLSWLPVTSRNGHFEGMVSLHDAISADKKGLSSLQDFVNKSAPTVNSETYIHELIPLYINENMPISVVDEEGKFLGIVPMAMAISIVMGEEYVRHNENLVPKQELEAK